MFLIFEDVHILHLSWLQSHIACCQLCSYLFLNRDSCCRS